MMAPIWKRNKGLASSVSCQHGEYKHKSHSGILAHSVHMHVRRGGTDTVTNTPTCTACWALGQPEDRVDTVFCKLLASDLWRPPTTVIWLVGVLLSAGSVHAFIRKEKNWKEESYFYFYCCNANTRRPVCLRRWSSLHSAVRRVASLVLVTILRTKVQGQRTWVNRELLVLIGRGDRSPWGYLAFRAAAKVKQAVLDRRHSGMRANTLSHMCTHTNSLQTLCYFLVHLFVI